MNSSESVETSQKPLRIFTFRRSSLIPYLVSFAIVTVLMLGVLIVFVLWDVEGSLLALQIGDRLVHIIAPPLILLTLPIAFTGAYTLYLLMVLRTATIVVTEYGVAYADRWVRRTLKWSDIKAVTPFSLIARQGPGIFLRLGLKGLDGWQEFLTLVREMSDARIQI